MKIIDLNLTTTEDVVFRTFLMSKIEEHPDLGSLENWLKVMMTNYDNATKRPGGQFPELFDGQRAKRQQMVRESTQAFCDWHQIDLQETFQLFIEWRVITEYTTTTLEHLEALQHNLMRVRDRKSFDELMKNSTAIIGGHIEENSPEIVQSKITIPTPTL